MGENVKQVTERLVLPILEVNGLELVDIEFKKEGANWFLRIFIDKQSGVDIDDCTSVSEALSAELDEADPIEQAYFLEVSSPGAERPLKKETDFENALGKTVSITTYEPIEGKKEWTGDLFQIVGDEVELVVDGPQCTNKVRIPFSKIAAAQLVAVI